MTAGTKISALFALGLVMVAALGITSYMGTQRLIETNRAVTHSHEVLDTLANALSLLKDAELRQRGFIITGEEQYLEPYHAALEGIRQRFDAVSALDRDDPAQKRNFERVRKLTEDRLASVEGTIKLRREGGFSAAQQ